MAFDLDPLSAWQAGANGFNCIWDVQMGPARQTSLGGDAFPLMQSHAVGRAGRPTGSRKHARLVCEWGLHPTTLLLAAGCSSPWKLRKFSRRTFQVSRHLPALTEGQVASW